MAFVRRRTIVEETRRKHFSLREQHERFVCLPESPGGKDEKLAADEHGQKERKREREKEREKDRTKKRKQREAKEQPVSFCQLVLGNLGSVQEERRREGAKRIRGIHRGFPPPCPAKRVNEWRNGHAEAADE